MSALILLIFLSLAFSLSALWVFLWAQRSGQFDLLSSGGEGEGAELPLLEGDESTQPGAGHLKVVETERTCALHRKRKGEHFEGRSL